MKCIEVPTIYKGDKRSVFLAGGITGCPDWQSKLINLLRNEDIVIFNPRRKNFPIHDPTAAEEQIKWEYKYLRRANAVAFWFPKESVCPIALYELGALSMTKKPLFVGVHPDYPRRRDVEIQIKLARPDIKIVYKLSSLANQIREWLRK
jgi:hypothetical protein